MAPAEQVKEGGKREEQKEIASLANEAANYLKSMKRAAATGLLSKRHADSLIVMVRDRLEEIEARLKK